MRKRLPALALLVIASLLFAQEDMNNAAVIKLLKAGYCSSICTATARHRWNPGRHWMPCSARWEYPQSTSAQRGGASRAVPVRAGRYHRARAADR